MPFSISTMPSVGAHWAASALGYSNGASVTAWADLSANAVDLTSSNAPTFVTGAINGQPAVRFNGSSNRLVSTVSIPTNNWAAPSYVAVLKIASNKNYNGIFTLDTVSPATDFNKFSGWSDSAGNAYAYGTGRFQGTTSSPLVWCMISYTHGIYSRANSFNGLLATASSVQLGVKLTANLLPTVGFWPFSGSWYGGMDLAELVIFNETYLSERIHIEGSLAAKYALSLHADHPFYSGAPTNQPGASGSSGGGSVLMGGNGITGIGSF